MDFDPKEVLRSLEQYYTSIYKNQYDHEKHRDHYLESILVCIDNTKHAILQREKLFSDTRSFKRNKSEIQDLTENG